jgi:hypothetical protein
MKDRNGRIESEVQQVTRRLRMLVRESGLGERVLAGHPSLRGPRAIAKPAANAGSADEAIASYRLEGHC